MTNNARIVESFNKLAKTITSGSKLEGIKARVNENDRVEIELNGVVLAISNSLIDALSRARIACNAAGVPPRR